MGHVAGCRLMVSEKAPKEELNCNQLGEEER